MKPILYLFTATLLVCSCKKELPPTTTTTNTVGYKELKSGPYQETDFSAWMTKAEQQVTHENKPKDQYYAFVEGRNNGGLNQYRHVMRPFPADKYSTWSVYWGLSSDEFYQLELKMLRDGFTRDSLQVFTDPSGKALHQVVWLK